MAYNETVEQPNLSEKRPVAEEQITDLEHISVCICTYKRPVLLVALLDGLVRQNTHNIFSYSVVIVDNEPDGSARKVVNDYIGNRLDNPFYITYLHEPVKGLTYARNKSIEHSRGEYIAFIDDDEVPSPDWLYHLYKALQEHDADAVFGTVLPKFEKPPANWVLEEEFFYWRDVRRGTGTKAEKAVTNNALVKREHIVKYNLKFDHDFAFAGGEDEAFFSELLSHKTDARYINCEEATVYEYMESDRCDPGYIRKRFILEGRGRIFHIRKFSDPGLRRKASLLRAFGRSAFRLLIIGLMLSFLWFVNRNLSNKYYYKSFFHIGIIMAIFRIIPYADRKSIGLL